MDTYLNYLLVTRPLIEPVHFSAVQALQLPPSSRGLDAGCGIGLQALQLAEAVGPDGHVTGVDISRLFLEYASDMVEKTRLSERISIKYGNLVELPFEDDSFDWAWSSDCVGYDPRQAVPMIKELVRVVRPGGLIAILAWSSHMFLPGYPALEARLNSTSAGIAPFAAGMKPKDHFLFGLGKLREIGLQEATARTFAGEVHAPMSDALRQAMIALFQMRWSGSEQELSAEDRALYKRLCLPQSPDFLLNHPDYYAFFTYSMFCGRLPNDLQG